MTRWRIGMLGAPDLSRRELLGGLAAGAGALALGCSSRRGNRGPSRDADGALAAGTPARSDAGLAPAFSLADLSPIAPVTGPATGYLGDSFTRPHEALWAQADFIRHHGGVPAPRERAAVVIVGGGLSGLASAYQLAAHRPIVLEQAPRFGGNARGERWNGIAYALGAAYLVKPEPDSALQRAFYGPLGVDREWREAPEDPVALGGRLLDGFWNGASDPRHPAQFRRAAAYLRHVLAEAYPDLPSEPDGALDARQLAALDGVSLRQHLEQRLGRLHPHLDTLLEHYCWSSFGGAMAELSAASGLNFLAAEFAGICALPGGNARIAERLLGELATALPPEALRPATLVVRVAPAPDGASVWVTAADPRGTLYTIAARAVVLAAPKFVCKKLLPGAPADQLAAMARLRYRAYVVANLLLDAPAPARALDLYLLGDGRTGRDIRAASEAQGVTDVIAGHWAQGGHPTSSVLTLYRAYPWDGARPLLYDERTLPELRDQLSAQLPAILALFGLTPDHLRELRVARWGHALPLAETGHLAAGVWARARSPIAERIFFVEQDNWPAPALETALTEALRSAPAVEAALG
ncbi:MAG: FAD-dependent oxidoreductase [Deltaproteobacteria bacterium]|nr:FAD-dependent oxidoreductase [Deltaproteobacteria bacterium]